MTTKIIITIVGVGALAVIGFMFFKRRGTMNGSTTTPASPLNPAAPPEAELFQESLQEEPNQGGLFAKPATPILRTVK